MLRLSVTAILAGVFLIMVGCKPTYDQPQNKSLYDEVMVIHDEVMPRMTDIHRLKKSIKQKHKDDLQNYPEAIDLLARLEEADNAMMNWMADFKPPKDESAAEAYLNAEKSKISEVSRLMKATIQEAETYLQ